jgi:hypothetical protein
MIVLKKRFLAQVMVLLMIVSLVSPTSTGFAQEDRTPPTLNSFTVSDKEATVDDQVKISADVTDDLSGVKSVRVFYRNPKDTGGKLVNLSYNSATGKYEGTFNVGQYDAEGKWKISSISVWDNQRNDYEYINQTYPFSDYHSESRDLSEYDINVYGTNSDVTPPTVNSFTVSAKEASVGNHVKMSADITDDLSGVKSVNVSYRFPNGGTRSMGLYYNSKTGKYEGTFPVNKNDAEGEYKLQNISVWDNQNNSIAYYNEKLTYIYRDLEYTSTYEDRDLSDYSIKIVPSDQISPVTKMELKSSLPKANEWYSSDVKVSLNATDDKSGVAKTLYKINDGDWSQYTNAFELQNEGVNTVEYKSIDNAGNVEETKSIEVKIDKTAPTLTVSFDQSVITNKNHKLVPINASVKAVDNLSGVDSYELVSIVSNQPDHAKGSGNTTQDIQGAEFGTSDLNFLVRAERSGSGDRVYTITYRATDSAGNTVTASQEIVVKHDNSKK